MIRIVIVVILSFSLPCSAISQCNFNNAVASVCSGLQLNFTPPNSSGYVFSWSTPDVSPSGTISGSSPQASPQPLVSQTLINSSFQPATATYTVVVAGPGCAAGQSFSLAVTVNPTPTVNVLADQEICPGDLTVPIIFTGSTPGTTFSLWGNTLPEIGLNATGSGNIPAFEVSNPFDSEVTAEINIVPSANGCTGAFTTVTSITVKLSPVVFTEQVQSVCEGQPTSEIFLDADLPGTNFNWINSKPSIGLPGAGTQNPIPSIISTNPGDTILTGIITVTPEFEGCIGLPAVVSSITVRPKPTANSIAPQIVCNGGLTGAIIFSGPVPNTTFSGWTSSNPTLGIGGNGTGNINPFNTTNFSDEQITGIITITPTANGCAGDPTEVTSVTVKPSPVVDQFPNVTVCPGVQVNITDFTSSNESDIFSWTNNNTSTGIQASGTGNIPLFTSQNSSATQNTSYIQVTASEPGAGCIPGEASPFFIIINPTPVISISPLTNSLCSGTILQNVILSSSVPGSQFHWTNNDPDLIELPDTGTSSSFTAFEVHNLTDESVSGTVSFTPVAGGCSGTPQVLTVDILPEPFITGFPSVNFCDGDEIPQIQLVSNLPGSDFSWQNSNTSIGLQASDISDFLPAFTAVNTSDTIAISQISITTIAINGCHSLFIDTIAVLPEGSNPDAQFTHTLNGAVNNFTILNNLGIDSVSWNFGDQNSGSGINATHTYAQNGNYTVTAIVINSCGTADTSTIVINVDVGFSVISNKKEFNLWPNPSGGFVNLNLNKPADERLNFDLLDLSGRILISGILNKGETNKLIDLSSIAPGNYFFRITSSGKHISGQLIKF